MKKFLHKDKKDKEEKKEEKKKEKKEKKAEKKERKEKEKKSKKDKRSASSASLEVPDSPQRTSQSTTIVTRTTITSDGPGGETKTTVVKAETVKEGERVSETKTEEVTGHSDENNVIQKTTTTTITQSQPNQPAETETVVKETTIKSPQGEEKVVITKTTSKGESFPPTREVLMDNFPEAAQLETTKHIQQIIHDSGAPPTHVSERTVIREVNDGGKTVKTVTKVVSDDEGKRETTTTTSSGGRDEEKMEDKDKEEKENEDGWTEANEELEEVKTDQPTETKTVVKETTKKTPQGEEKVIITKTTSEVQSFPSTREFLMDNFPEAAQLETTKHIQQIIHDSGAPPTHVSERTVIREVNDGGKTVKTVTKVVSDDEGKRETTTMTTKTSGGKDEEKNGVEGKDEKENENEDNKDIVSEIIDRKADLPEWLNNISDTSTEKGEVKIDDSIEIPSPSVKRKQPEDKPKPTGPKVIEEVNPITNSKENLMDMLDHLEDMGQEKPKEVKPKPPEEIPFDYEPKKPEKRIYTGDPITENVYTLKTVNKTEAEIDFETLEKREEPKPTHIVQQTHTRKIITTNGDTVETVTKTVTDEDGQVKTMETKTISARDQKPNEKSDNNNSKESIKSKTSPIISKKNLQTDIKKSENVLEEDQDDVKDDGREILEEIIVIEKKRKVRIPKSFVPYEKKRPKAVIPFDLLIQRQRSPRKLPPVGRRVDENIVEQSHDSKREIPDLNELDRLLSEMQAQQ